MEAARYQLEIRLLNQKAKTKRTASDPDEFPE
jgi:hypothetical protein